MSASIISLWLSAEVLHSAPNGLRYCDVNWMSMTLIYVLYIKGVFPEVYGNHIVP